MKVIREGTDVLLMEYASGALDEACSLLVASYITICPEARRYVRQCESYGGALIEHCCEPVAMHKDSIKAVLGQLDDRPQKTKTEAKAKTAAPAQTSAFCKNQPLPRPLKNHVDHSHRPLKWRTAWPGLQFCRLPVSDGRTATTLIRMAPGVKAMRHDHPGTEYTLVLEGGYHDEFGQYKAGDLVIVEDHIRHRPVADDTGCLCLVATDTPVRYTGSFGALINILIR